MFYTFSQNNSGRSRHRSRFDHDSFNGIGYKVVIEADSADEANVIAESIGIYFNGCDDDRDCPCCGDRWYPAWESGNETPTMYGGPVTGGWGIPSYIHYKNGTVAAVGDER